MAAQCADQLNQTAEVFDMRSVREKLDARSDPDPLKTVLYQELDRYDYIYIGLTFLVFIRFLLFYSYTHRHNFLMSTLRRTLTTVIKVAQRTASITPDLEDVMVALGQLKVLKF
jgi:hypothetical protein